jgi:hypothetical protein
LDSCVTSLYFKPVFNFGFGAPGFLTTEVMSLYSFRRFTRLSAEKQIHQLSLHAIALDLAYCTDGAEAVLFAYHDFYVELVVEKYTDEILSIKSFRSVRKLAPYLHQIDITEITALLACSK